MSKRIMQENLEQVLQLSEQELDSVVGGAVKQVTPMNKSAGGSGLPLPRPGGGIGASLTPAEIAAVIAGLIS
jgi:hypothetical protein